MNIRSTLITFTLLFSLSAFSAQEPRKMQSKKTSSLQLKSAAKKSQSKKIVKKKTRAQSAVKKPAKKQAVQKRVRTQNKKLKKKEKISRSQKKIAKKKAKKIIGKKSALSKTQRKKMAKKSRLRKRNRRGYLVASTQLARSKKKSSKISKKLKKKKKFGVSVTMERSRSTVRHLDGTDFDGFGMSISPSYRFTNKLSGFASIAVSHDIKGDTDEVYSWAGGSLGLRYSPFALGKYFSLSPAVGATLPVTKAQRELQGLMIGIAPSARLLLNTKKIGAPKLTAFYNLSVGRNFHEFFESTDGGINTEYNLIQTIVTAYQITDKLSVNASFTTIASWNYEGKQSDFFSAGQGISYQMNPNWGFGVSHGNQASALKANGQTSNVSLFDEDTSMISASMSYTY